MILPTLRTATQLMLTLAVAGGAADGLHAAVDVIVHAPEAVATAGARTRVELVLLNSGAQPETLTLPAELAATLATDDGRWPVRLRPGTTGEITVAAGGFARVPAVLDWPAGAQGAGVVEVTGELDARWAVVVQPTAGAADDGVVDAPAPPKGAAVAASPEAGSRGRSRQNLVPRSVMSHIERSFSDRFQPHEPVYFLWGPDDPAAKFQFSLKYRIMGFDGPLPDDVQPRRAIYFGYTQRSLWDLDAESSPFFDTSYMPELFFEWQAADAQPEGGRRGWLTWLGWQAGVQHESNGRDGDGSRSLNMAYLRPGLALGNVEGWRLIVTPRVYAYVGGLSDNPTLDDYRGFSELRAIFGRNGGVELSATGRVGQGGHFGQVQLDLTVPLRLRSRDFAVYMIAQYFDGYGESLRDFDLRSRRWRVGFALVR